ncbi:MAG: hypothetical protein KME31_04355 [Tolypothrix carrinoi HA7290-LM1]|nr:hypothetical protein [Tolypothrix carrinoi HA7290-LM1]
MEKQLSTNNHQPTTINQQPSTNNYQPFGFVRCFKSGNPPNALTHQQLSTNNYQPTTINHQPTTNNQQPTTINPSGSSDASSRETRPTH